MKTIIALELLKIEDDGHHLAAQVLINNIPARVLIDSGASRTVFDKDKIFRFDTSGDYVIHEKLSTGLGTSSMPTGTTTLKKFSIGDLVLQNYTVIVLDLTHVNHSYESLGLLPIDGVIGNDILQPYKAIINYEELTLSLKE